jgi:hypothetical protein
MERVLGAIAVAALLGGCTSVKMVQRDGCWIKRTEKIFGRVQEEIGPCGRATPNWVQDRYTRVVQECVVQADHLWQGRAVDAWSKGLPYPAQQSHEEILRTCLKEADVGLANENDRLKERLGEVATDRDALRLESEQGRGHLRESYDKLADHLRTSHERIADHLGEAAKRPAGTAHATANASSDGKATTENGTTLSADSGSAPATATSSSTAPLIAAPSVAAATAAPEKAASAVSTPAKSKPVAARGRRPNAAMRAAKAPRCEPAPACAPAAPAPQAAAAEPSDSIITVDPSVQTAPGVPVDARP